MKKSHEQGAGTPREIELEECSTCGVQKGEGNCSACISGKERNKHAASIREQRDRAKTPKNNPPPHDLNGFELRP